MRHVLSTLAAVTFVAGCAHEAPTASRLVTSATPVAAKAAAPAAAAKAVAPAVTREVVTAEAPEAAEVADNEPAGPVIAGAPAAVAEAAVTEAPEVAADFAPRFSIAADATPADAEAASLLDPWRPYGVGVVAKTGTSVTLAWRTDLKTKAIVYYGKSLGLTNRGYDGVAHDPNKSTYHEITIGGLSRFRSYTFAVVGLGELTLQYPAYPIKTRTRLLF